MNQQTNKSPFFVVQEFISPLICEEMVDALETYEPDTDTKGNPVKMSKYHELSELALFERFQRLIPSLEQHYNIDYVGTERVLFQWYPEGSAGTPHCESSSYLNKKWVRTKNRDVSFVLFLSDYQDNIPFESDYEVYGGKLEFPQWGFGFNPQRGTLIGFPSDPHFINVTTPIMVGDLFQAKFHIAAASPLLFNSKNFPGDYREWFKEFV